MKRFLSLILVLAALFIGGCDFLGEDAGDGDSDGGEGGGQEQTLVVKD